MRQPGRLTQGAFEAALKRHGIEPTFWAIDGKNVKHSYRRGTAVISIKDQVRGTSREQQLSHILRRLDEVSTRPHPGRFLSDGQIKRAKKRAI